MQGTLWSGVWSLREWSVCAKLGVADWRTLSACWANRAVLLPSRICKRLSGVDSVAMLAADTNIVVRLLVSDDLAQQAAVRNRLKCALDAGIDVLIPDIVLADVSWVLDSLYGYTRKDIANALQALTETPPFVLQSASIVVTAIESYRTMRADFADYLILGSAVHRGAERLLTFDRRLLDHPLCEAP